MGVFRIVILIGLLVFPCCHSEAPLFMCPSTRITHSGINTAYLSVNSYGVNSTIILQLVSSECHTCQLQNVTYVPAGEKNCSVIVDTRWPVKIAIVSNSTEQNLHPNCTNGHLDYTFVTGGKYFVYVFMKNGTVTCQRPMPQNAPSDSNIAIYVTIGIFAALALIWVGFKRSRRSCLKMLADVTPVSVVDDQIVSEQDLGTPTNITHAIEPEKTVKKERLRSLDTFRGISLVVMMFVNYGGGGYWFFSHSVWNGLTVADLVFPWFIWIMGTALAFSFQSMVRSKASKGVIFLKICRRTVILFALGILVNSGGSKNFTHWRIFGVLQRFSITYLITASTQLLFMTKSKKLSEKWRNVKDVVLYWQEWLVQLMLLTVYLCLTFLLPVPGCPTGYIGPGGLANDKHGYNVSQCTGGAAGYIDRKVFGDKLVYHHPTCAEVYDTSVPYDPEGLLGCLTSCFLCFLGLQAGKILSHFSDFRSRVKRFIIWCIFLGTIAAILCKASKNDGWIPVNKNLWSVSYILTMASMAFALFTFCYLMIDVYKLWSGAPFYYPGMNSIVVYVCHEVFSQPFQSFWVIDASTHAIAMLINIWDVTFWVLMSLYLYHREIFIAI